MKMLLAFFLLLSGQAWSAATAANTIAVYYFQNNADDYSDNAYNLTTVGTVPYGGAPVAPAVGGSAGKFSDANYYTGPAGLNTAVSSLSAYTVQGYYYLDTLTSQPVLWRYVDSAENYGEVLNTGAVFWVSAGDPNLSSAAGVVPEDTWTHIAWVWNGTNRTIYVNGASVATTASGNNTGTVGTTQIGRYGTGGFALDGYMAQLRFSNAALSSFPTTDPNFGTTDTLSPYQWNGNTPRMFPNQLPLLLKWFLMPKNLPALEADSRPVATAVAVQAVRSRLEYTERLVSEGRITRTRTPTATPVSGTRTPSATATPTHAPARVTPTITPRQR